jgi:UDP-GlcNAc3NAcA epimerase
MQIRPLNRNQVTVKLLTIVGARPQFVKAAVVSHAIRKLNLSSCAPKICESIIHTGQHYDDDMSEVFFRELDIPRPVVNLGIGSGLHGQMTGGMLAAIESEALRRKPDWVLVYGDTDSTLAGALSAAKLHVRVAHVEAGMRSFNRRMPEEVNRVLTDHVSDLLFCATSTAVSNLQTEGITRGVHKVGDVMYDAALLLGHLASDDSRVLFEMGVRPRCYYLATVHRAENTDSPLRLGAIVKGLGLLACEETPVVFPVHPRTTAALASLGPMIGSALENKYLKLTTPASFLNMVALERNARAIITDSGGVQKEAYFHGVPCVTVRQETEWVETVEHGWNQLVAADAGAIVDAVARAKCGQPIEDFGRGDTAEQIVQILANAEINDEWATTR